MSQTTYINLFGGPGVGKSTLAAGVFYELKKRGLSIELVTEYVKELVWENRLETLTHQPYISMKQFRNLSRVKGKVDLVITDSPMLKDYIYANRYCPELPEAYYDLLAWAHHSLGNGVNIVLNRAHEYRTEGRLQTLKEAVALDNSLFDMLNDLDIEYYECDPTVSSVLEILEEIL